MGQIKRHFEGFYADISSDIFKFCAAMNFKPTWQQRDLFIAVMLAKSGKAVNWIAVKSGQGPGKTTAAVIVALWCSIRAYMALTVVTAPTMRQCREVFLGECRRLMELADPLLQTFIKVTKSKVEIAGKPGWGIQLATATKSENVQGFHQKNMTVILEEMSGIPKEIVTQFKGTLSNPDALMVGIGNPNTRDCEMFHCFNSQRSRWQTFTWNAEDTARDYPEILNPQRNRDLESEFGRDSDVYRIRVLGEFPHKDPNCVLSSEELEHVCAKSMFAKALLMPRDGSEQIAKQFGLDFARYGGDENVLFRRSGNAIVDWEHWAHTDPNDVVAHAFRIQAESFWRDHECWYVADAGGMGQGVMHRFHTAQKQLVEFHNNACATHRDYANLITEGYFKFALKVRQQRCFIPSDNLLIQQLCGRRYYTNLKGKLILETKDDYMKRGFESPDRADAAVLAFFDEVQAAVRLADNRVTQHVVGSSYRGVYD